MAVGRQRQWFGTKPIDGKYVAPAWSPPAEVKRDNPRLPNLIAGGSPPRRRWCGGHGRPRGRRIRDPWHQPAEFGGHLRIYGCIRMYNQDVVDLYARVDVGTQVYMTH